MNKPSLAVAVTALAILVALPILVVVSNVLFGSYSIWQHLIQTVMADYVINSVILALGVSLGVFFIAVPTAWLVSIYDFPLRRYFVWGLLLPFAMPAYIIAYTYTGLLDFAGPVQSSIRELTGWQYGEYWFIEIRSLTGAITMLTLVLYPYVYLLARTAFVNQSASILEAAQNLGNNHWQSLWRVALPIARPAIIAGMSLALMETLADYGTVQYFGVSTFTTGIFRAFYGFGDLAAAAQLAGTLLIFVMALLFLERYSRKQSSYVQPKVNTAKRVQLSGKKAYMASIACFLPILFGFIIPVTQLGLWTMFESVIGGGFFGLAWNSFYLAALAAILVVSCGVILAYTKRIFRKPFFSSLANVAAMGYAIPGTIIAIGILIPLSWLDHQLIGLFKSVWQKDIGLVFSGTIGALLFAYVVRFLAVSMGAVDSGLKKIPSSLDSAASLMGYKSFEIFNKVHLPLLRGSLLTCFLIVFVDVLKELPATLILRPFDFNTLAVRAYELASDERLIDAAPASLTIVLVGLIPVILLSYSINKTSDFEQKGKQ